jgi:hypothetical protein
MSFIICSVHHIVLGWSYQGGCVGGGGAVVCMGEGRSAYKILVRKSEGKRPLGRHSLMVV